MSTPPVKPTWTRHPSCKTRIYNDPYDIEVHKQNCPADLKRDLANLAREITVLVRRVGDLEERPVAETNEPTLNDEIAEWEPINDTDDGHQGEPAEHPTDDDLGATQAFDATSFYPAIDRDDEIEVTR